MPIVSLRKNWSQGNALDAVLSAFNSQTSVNEEGAISFQEVGFQQLFSLLDDAFSYPDTLSGRELTNIIYRAMIDARKLGDVEREDLLIRVNAKAVELVKLPLVKFMMWTNLRLKWTGNSGAFKLNVNKVLIRGVPRLPDNLVLSEYFLNGYGRIKPNEYFGYGYVICSVDARNEDDAARQIFEALDIFTSITNAIWRDWNILGGEHHAEAKLWNGPHQFFFEKKKFLGDQRLWFNSDFNKEEWERWPKSRLEFDRVLPAVRRGIKKLADHPLRSVIIRSLKLLNDGMIAKDSSYRLLRYWSALEVVFSNINDNTRTDIIIKRSLFAEKEPLLDRLKLEYLSSIRNRYVHEGLGNDNIYYLIQFLREHVAKHIVYLIFQGADFENHGDYLAMCDLPHAQVALEKRREAIMRRELINTIGRHKPVQKKPAKTSK